MPDRKKDRRRLERFELSAPAMLVVDVDGRDRSRLELTTKDVSSAGAYLFCPRQLRVGAQVRMELLIGVDRSSTLAGQNGRSRFKVRGTVIRAGTDGIAIHFESRFKITAIENGNPASGSF